jgi:hypothetical protein
MGEIQWVETVKKMILVEENNNTEGGLQERQNTKTYVKHSDS